MIKSVMKNTIKRNNDFKRIYQRGKSFADSLLVTYILRNRSNDISYGITASKKIGNAVKRNRARRVIKESFREISNEFDMKLISGVQIVFVARYRTTLANKNDIKKIMQTHLIRVGLITKMN